MSDLFNEDEDNTEDNSQFLTEICPLCDKELACFRFMEALDDTVFIAWICRSCFEQIKPRLEEQPTYINNVLQYIKKLGTIKPKEEIIDGTDPDIIKSLGPGIYKIDPKYVEKLYNSVHSNPQNFVNGDFDASLNEKLNEQYKINNQLEGLIDKSSALSGKNNKKKNSQVRNTLNDPLIDPTLMFRESVLAEKCSKCSSNLETFLRQLAPGCGYCFVSFNDKIQEYVSSVNMNRVVEKKQNLLKNKRLSIRNQITLNEGFKQEAIDQQDWTKAAYYRDIISDLTNKLNSKSVKKAVDKNGS